MKEKESQVTQIPNFWLAWRWGGGETQRRSIMLSFLHKEYWERVAAEIREKIIWSSEERNLRAHQSS